MNGESMKIEPSLAKLFLMFTWFHLFLQRKIYIKLSQYDPLRSIGL